MTYNGTPQTAVITDPYDSNQTAPVSASDGLRVQLSPEDRAMMMEQLKYLVAIWATLSSEPFDKTINPDNALKEIMS